MATVSWISSTGGDWSVGANWQGGTAPGAADDVLINVTATETITVSTTQQAHSVTINAPAATFDLASTGALYVTGDVSLNVGALQIDGLISSGAAITASMTSGNSIGILGSLQATAFQIGMVGSTPAINVGSITATTILPIAGGLITFLPQAVTAPVIDTPIIDIPVIDILITDTTDFPAGTATLRTDLPGHGTISCYARGTRIETATGHLPIEQLVPGDLVRLVGGGTAPITWIGHRRVDCRRHPEPERVLPIRIAPHAFGHDRPRRALLLSPDHSVFVEDVLIPIKFLVNRTTVAPVDVKTVTYYHIELAHHDVVLAEGLPAETYLETGGRSAFENGGPAVQLHPDFAADNARVAMIWNRLGYAPLLGTNGELDRVRAGLAAQASMLGYGQARMRSGVQSRTIGQLSSRAQSAKL